MASSLWFGKKIKLEEKMLLSRVKVEEDKGQVGAGYSANLTHSNAEDHKHLVTWCTKVG